METPENATVVPPISAPPSTWWSRNRRWMLPLLIISPLLLCCLSCGGGVGIIYMVRNTLRQSGPYLAAMEAIDASPQVREALGEGIHESGWMPLASGNLATGPLNLQIQIEGSKGSGLAVARTEQQKDHWEVVELTVTPTGGERITIIGTPAAAAPEEKQQ